MKYMQSHKGKIVVISLVCSLNALILEKTVGAGAKMALAMAEWRELPEDKKAVRVYDISLRQSDQVLTGVH